MRSFWGNLTILVAVVVGSGMTRPASAQDGYASYAGEIATADALVREKVDSENIPGYAVAVYASGRMVWAQGFGYSNVELGSPVLPNSRFRIGSVAKTFTSSLLALLVRDGRLDLDAPVQQYVPSFPVKNFPVTTRQLAGHLAGIRHYQGDENMNYQNYETVLEGLEIFADDPLLFEPETDYSYSSYGWNLLSAVLEGAAGEPFLEMMQRRVFGPLGMLHTGPDRIDSIIPQRTGYYVQRDGAVLNARAVDNSYKWAGGGFLSSVEDLVRYGAAHLAPGYLDEESLALLQTSQRLRSGEQTDYGMGWRVWTTDSGRRAVGHTGGSVGGTTAMVLFPEEGVVVAVIANMSGASRQAQTALAIGELFVR